MSDHQKNGKLLVSREKKKKKIFLISKCSASDMKRLVLTYFTDGFVLAVCLLGC